MKIHPEDERSSGFFNIINKKNRLNAINTPFTMGGFKEQYTGIQALAYKTNHILHRIHDEFQGAHIL